ncbi:NAD(P)-dependent oxidoreductase [Faecalibacterium sp. OF04-11AC]|uniref:NAD(P)-dependent oxidoreductase n=1 Tax=Faecalibacterium sp. OF04-11AC TaxID=2293109 RepID=UPI001FA8D8FA|nr:NAD(P)-dependent oxidoreductase [Faecalibacterium sp. OF04-11AC]
MDGTTKTLCGDRQRCPAAGGRPGAGPGGVCGGGAGRDRAGRLYPAAVAAGRGPHPAGGAAAGGTPGALALGGMLSEEAKAIAAEAGVELVDYFAREELAIRNAIPTAEGCIGVLLAQRKRTLWGSAVLLLGFGPVGQAVGTRLAALGAHVTVAARRPAQRAQAESLGMQGAELARLARLAPAFDTVVNTIPAQVLTAPVLARLRPGSLIVDLASRPGGTDFDAAARCGHKAIHALSLPAACAPETAGEIVARTVCEMLREREGAR